MDPRARALCEGRNFAHVTTLLRNGAPLATVVWFDVMDDDIVFCKGENSLTVSNIRRDPRLAISVHDEANPYRSASFRGHVVELRGEPDATRVVHHLAAKYEGRRYPDDGSSSLVMMVVRIDRSRSEDITAMWQ